MSEKEITELKHDPKRCPTCGRQGVCKDSRPGEGYVRRRYRCRSEACDARWTTAEFYVPEGYSVRDGVPKFLLSIGRDGIRTHVIAAIDSLKALL